MGEGGLKLASQMRLPLDKAAEAGPLSPDVRSMTISIDQSTSSRTAVVGGLPPDLLRQSTRNRL